MIEVTRIQAIPSTPYAIDLSWEVRPTFDPLEDYSFTVLRSESVGGPFTRISGPIVFPAAFLFRDNQVNAFSKIRAYRYRIRVTGPTGDTLEFGSRTREERARTGEIGSVGIEAEPDRIVLAMNRRFELLLRAKVGRPVMVLSRMTFGQYCENYDAELQKHLRADCRQCWGTNFAGGYYSPVLAWLRVNPKPKGIRRTEIGEVHPAVSVAELGRFPPLKPGDLLVERENVRWHVGTVQTTEKRRAASRQIAQISQLEAGRVELQIPVAFPQGHIFVPEPALRPRMDLTSLTGARRIIESGG